MKARHIILIFATFLITIFAIIDLISSRSTIANGHDTRQVDHKSPQRRFTSDRDGKTLGDNASSATDRKTLFDELKREWLQLENIEYWNIKGEERAKREELAYRSIMSLGLSRELFALSKFIHDNEIEVSSSPISLLSFYLRLVSSGDIEIDHSDFDAFLATYRDMGDIESSSIVLGVIGKTIAQQIERHDEFDKLYAKLLMEDKRLAQDAAFAFHESQALSGRVRIDEAISAIAEQRKVGGDAMKVDRKINSLIANYLSSGRDFSFEDVELIEESISNLSGHPHFSERAAVQHIMAAWGRHDPTEALNKVLENTDRYPAESSKYISASGFPKIVREHGEQAAIDWLRRIPEGPHRVQAIIGAFDIVHENRDLARDVANLLPANERETLVNMAKLEHHDDD